MPTFARSLLIALGLSSFGLHLADAGNWERFRGPNGTGFAPDKDIPVKFDESSGILWKLPLPGLGNSSPIVWGKRLFVQTATADGGQRLLVCVDVTRGKELWSRGIPGAKAPTHAKNSLASATPVTDGEAVFVPFWDGKEVFMVAYDFEGKLLWNKNLGTWVSQHGTGGSPILYKDKVILANDMDSINPRTKEPVQKPSTLFALSKKTGEVLWEVPRVAYRACYSAPFLLEKPGAAPELIVTSSTALTSYNPEDGSELWHWKPRFTSKMPLRTISAPYYSSGMLFACSGDGGGDRQMWAVALEGAGKSTRAKEIWDNKKDFPYVPNLLLRDNHIYFVNDKGFAGCYEPRTGKKCWFERIPETNFTASPVLIDDKVYAPSEEGDVYVFAASPTAYEPLAKNSLGERLRATPAVADGRLYIRGQNHLFCIGRK